MAIAIYRNMQMMINRLLGRPMVKQTFINPSFNGSPKELHLTVKQGDRMRSTGKNISLPVTSSCQGSHNSAIFASIEASFSSGGDPAGTIILSRGGLSLCFARRDMPIEMLYPPVINCSNRKSSNNKMEVLMRKSKIIYKLAIFHCHV